MCFIEDKDPKSCIDRLRPLIDEGPENLKAHGRLLMGHAYRSMGRQRLAIFNYQAVARRENVDEATIIALAALTEIGDASSQKLAQSRIDLLRQQDPAPRILISSMEVPASNLSRDLKRMIRVHSLDLKAFDVGKNYIGSQVPTSICSSAATGLEKPVYSKRSI